MDLLPNSRDIAAARAHLHSAGRPVVGWGTGSVFDYFHQLYPVSLDALVDNDARRWGTTLGGIPVVPPSFLDRKAGVLVVIYSGAWPAIAQQVRRLGRHTPVPASAFFASDATLARLVRSEALLNQSTCTRTPRPDHAIVVQGPVTSDTTARVARLAGSLNPDAAILLSTSNDTPTGLLETVRPLVDEIVLTDRPTPSGVQNRNAQIVSTRAGIARARQLGARTILKLRSDLVSLVPNVFTHAARFLDGLDHSAAQRAGLHSRILVPSSFTRQYLLYHPSDMVMLGHADDLLQYWSAPLDPRAGDRVSDEWLHRPLSEVNLAGHPAESYLGTAFCRTLGRPLRGTLDDSWGFYRDLFAVVDNDWLELLWFKNLEIPDARATSRVRACVAHAFWQGLVAGQAADVIEQEHPDPSTVTLGALSGLSA